MRTVAAQIAELLNQDRNYIRVQQGGVIISIPKEVKPTWRKRRAHVKGIRGDRASLNRRSTRPGKWYLPSPKESEEFWADDSS